MKKASKIAFGILAVFVLTIVIVSVTVKGQYTFTEFWTMFFDKIFNWNAFISAFKPIISRVPTSFIITLIAMAIGLVLGLLLALIKLNRIPVLDQIRALAVSFIRGTPIYVQLLLTYTGIPLILKAINLNYGMAYNINDISPMLFVILTFAFNEAAYNSETIRAAIESVDVGQIEAAKSLGMTNFQVFKRVTLPEAATVAVAPLGNALMGLLKGTSLAFVAGVIEMTAEAKIIGGSSFRVFESYLAVALVYWAINLVFENLIRLLERKLQITPKQKNKRHLIPTGNPFEQGSVDNGGGDAV
ncbi:amino acid ABC transporter permease [Lactococcus laudensis]|uniref:Amino acid ABC transporter permease n=1 Tax=Pseudolactococcus laudensis TaxID=1494461 RepID=A0A7V8N002_9LACT|nr:amino acid ABC transporter permease [Lactococcus laudensis]MBA0016173.1 amino acid ABC transporter permease [Lactococcus laudensis]MBW9280496.1 amino acid ABC transporter permease [Lactococcus laudensis]